MSDILEGVVFRNGSAAVQPVLERATHPVILEQVGDGLRSISRTDTRETGPASEEMEHIAEQVSEVTGSALLFRYDSRIGHRSSTLYERGKPVREFGLADERWVRLDEHGERILNGRTYSADELDPDPNAEYETLQNAIELGLDAFGAGNWDEILERME
jgi:hypothetical protein